MKTCDGSGVLYQCDMNGVIATQSACGNSELCMASLSMQQCVKCLPGKFQCQGTALLGCADPAAGMTTIDTCDSAALCDEVGGKCTPAACAPGEFKCMGDELQQCSPDRSKFDRMRTCGRGLCNQQRGQCNECAPGTPPVCEGQTSLVSCGSDGQEIRETCSDVCNGNRCAQCIDFDTQSCEPSGSPECSGTQTCLLGFWGSCQMVEKRGVAEKCDGLDNDCDGTPDNCPSGTECTGESSDCLPPGSYLGSCENCRSNGSTLTCDCCSGPGCPLRRGASTSVSCSGDICQFAGCLICNCSTAPPDLTGDMSCP